MNKIRETVGTGPQGTTLLGIKRGAELLGFSAQAVRFNHEMLEQLKVLTLPAIIHWKGYHFVVFYGMKGRKYIIADPGVGLLYLSKKELLSGWKDGVTLLVEPDPIRFYAEPDEVIGGFDRLLRRTWNYRVLILRILLLSCTLGIITLVSPLLIQVLTDDVLIRGDIQLLNKIVISVISLSIISSGLSLVQSVLIAYLSQKLELGLILDFGHPYIAASTFLF